MNIFLFQLHTQEFSGEDQDHHVYSDFKIFCNSFHFCLQNFLEKNKNGGMHHICIEVNDIRAAMNDLTAQNIRCLSKEPKIGAHGKPVVFLHPKDCAGVLVELEEV